MFQVICDQIFIIISNNEKNARRTHRGARPAPRRDLLNRPKVEEARTGNEQGNR